MVAADRTFRNGIATDIERGIASGEFPVTVHPQGLATVMVAMLRAVTLESLLDEEVDLEACRSEIEQLLTERLRASGAPPTPNKEKKP
ncbi:MAG TPA: hypothetical protein VIW24_31155 [Aldersonia sp.]